MKYTLQKRLALFLLWWDPDVTVENHCPNRPNWAGNSPPLVLMRETFSFWMLRWWTRSRNPVIQILCLLPILCWHSCYQTFCQSFLGYGLPLPKPLSHPWIAHEVYSRLKGPVLSQFLSDPAVVWAQGLYELGSPLLCGIAV